jgi:phage terminase small subunit
MVDLNATQAAIRAGYSAARASEIGYQLLQKTPVKAAIEALQKEESRRLGLTRERWLKELAGLAYSDVGDILDFTGEEPRLRPTNTIPKRARRTISSYKTRRYLKGRGDEAKTVEITECKLWDKLSALEKLGKHFGWLSDKLDLTGSVIVQTVEGVAKEEVLGEE